MQSNLILTAAQAQAVYSAMCALNNVCARVQVSSLDSDGLEVREHSKGAIVIGYLVGHAQRGTVLESHADQAAFAAAYGLAGMPDLPGLVETATDALRLIGKLDPAHPNAVAVHQRLGMALKVAA